MVAVIYIVLASAMFFLQDTYFLVGGVEFSLKNPCAVGILFLALLNFTVTVRPGRTIVLIRHTVIQVFPYLIPFFFSAIIWVVSGADSITIVNGVGMIVPQILSVLIAAATLYLFGEKGALYCLGAMCVANFIKVLTVAMEGGIGDFTFAFGPFLIYLVLWRKKIPHTFLWFFVTLVLFLLGLKRIVVPAVALGFVVAIFVRMLPKKAARQAAMCLAAGMIIVSFMYIVGIRSGLFLYMEEKLGINTMGRMAMFANLEPYYDISIIYMGKGTGFERFVDWASGVEYQVPLRTLMPIHNDFLRMYMNIGFAGYWIWIISFLMVRLHYWFRRAGKEAGCLFLGISIYCFVLYATDNTIYYPYTMIACAILPMSCCLDRLADAEMEEHRTRWEKIKNRAEGSVLP